MLDLVVIGGGHNGLTAAAYIAAHGFKVAVLEQRPIVGGAAATEEFHPGFRNSVAAYAVSLLHPKIIADLDLARHGLRSGPSPTSSLIWRLAVCGLGFGFGFGFFQAPNNRLIIGSAPKE